MGQPRLEPVPIILLAAGESSRLGQPKQLLTIRGISLLRRTAMICLESGVGPVVVILGSQIEIMRHELDGLSIDILHNVDWASGLASSVRCGIKYFTQSNPKPEAVIFVLCDQVMLTPAVIQQVHDRYLSSGVELISCRFGEEFGPPTLVGRPFFDELLTLTGQQGAKKLITKYSEIAEFVPFEGGGVDIDVPKDLAKLNDL